MIWPARPFYRGALSSLRARTLHMDVPIAIAITAAFAHGVVNTFAGPRARSTSTASRRWCSCCSAGASCRSRAQRAAVDSAELLHALSPATARVRRGRRRCARCPPRRSLPGMVFEVRDGETLAGDGVVLEGRSELDRALLTGESVPQAVGPGDEVFAGTVNRGAALRIRVERAGEASRVGQILREVERSASRRAPVVRTADALAGRFVARGAGARGDHVVALARRGRHARLRLRDRAADRHLSVRAGAGDAAGHHRRDRAGRARAASWSRAATRSKRSRAPRTLVLDKTGTLTEGRIALVAWEGSDAARGRWCWRSSVTRRTRSPRAFAPRGRSSTAPAADGRARDHGRRARGRGRGPARARGLAGVGAAPARATRAALGARGRGRPRSRPCWSRWTARSSRAPAWATRCGPTPRATLDVLRARGWTTRLLSGDAPAVVAALGAASASPPEDAGVAPRPRTSSRRSDALARCGPRRDGGRRRQRRRRDRARHRGRGREGWRRGLPRGGRRVPDPQPGWPRSRSSPRAPRARWASSARHRGLDPYNVVGVALARSWA